MSKPTISLNLNLNAEELLYVAYLVGNSAGRTASSVYNKILDEVREQNQMFCENKSADFGLNDAVLSLEAQFPLQHNHYNNQEFRTAIRTIVDGTAEKCREINRLKKEIAAARDNLNQLQESLDRITN